MADTVTAINAAQLATLDARAGRGFAAEGSITSNVTFGATETVIMFTSSMTWTNNRAYRVEVWGLHQYPTTNNYALYRIRKGTTTAGTAYKDQIRLGSIPVAGTNSPVVFTTILTNTTGADIVTAVCLTAIQGTVAQTWTFSASVNNVAYMVVTDIGSTANYTGQPIS